MVDTAKGQPHEGSAGDSWLTLSQPKAGKHPLVPDHPL
jgi:hypothetical protein